jgi:hypothetical protein
VAKKRIRRRRWRQAAELAAWRGIERRGWRQPTRRHRGRHERAAASAAQHAVSSTLALSVSLAARLDAAHLFVQNTCRFIKQRAA